MKKKIYLVLAALFFLALIVNLFGKSWLNGAATVYFAYFTYDSIMNYFGRFAARVRIEENQLESE